MDEREFYLEHSLLTDPGSRAELFAGLSAGTGSAGNRSDLDIARLSDVVRGVIVHRDERSRLFGFDLPEERSNEAGNRYVEAILDQLGDLRPRPAEQRFAVALLDAAARIGARSGPLDDAVALYRHSPELTAPMSEASKTTG